MDTFACSHETRIFPVMKVRMNGLVSGESDVVGVAQRISGMLTCVAFIITFLGDGEDSVLLMDKVAVPVLKLLKICLVCDESISVATDADEAACGS